MRSVNLTMAAAAVAASAILAAPPAQAAWRVAISGVWNTNAPETPYSSVLEPYSLSFILPSLSFSTIYQDADVSVTTEESDIQYTLNGVAIPVTQWTGDQADCSGLAVGTLCNVAFFDTSLDGALALAFSDHVVEFYGADVGSNGTLVPGDYIFIPNMDNTYVNEGTALASITYVPEPAAWTMMLLGVAAIGGVARKARGRAIRPEFA